MNDQINTDLLIKELGILSDVVKNNFDSYDNNEKGILGDLTSTTNLLLDFGYTVFYSLKEEEAERLGLSVPAIELKEGNHGSYWYTEDHAGDSFLTANISLKGKRTELVIPFTGIKTIYVKMYGLILTELMEVVSLAKRVSYARLFGELSKEPAVTEVKVQYKKGKEEPRSKNSTTEELPTNVVRGNFGK